LKIEVTKKGSSVEKGVINPRIFKEEVVEATMEVQAKSLEVTTTILEKINISVKRA
jgi:hypothetical protein